MWWHRQSLRAYGLRYLAGWRMDATMTREILGMILASRFCVFASSTADNAQTLIRPILETTLHRLSNPGSRSLSYPPPNTHASKSTWTTGWRRR